MSEETTDVEAAKVDQKPSEMLPPVYQRTIVGPMGTVETVVSRRLLTDWNEKLTDEHCIEKDGDLLPTLAGLQKLAREAGWIGSNTHTNHVSSKSGAGVFQCTVEVIFDDGTSWSGSADCNQLNTKKKFMSYPTAVSESRAMARALKVALGIFKLTAEEIGFSDDGFSSSPVTPETVGQTKIEPSQVKAIESALERRGMDFLDVAPNVLDYERVDEITSLHDLTTSEGSDILSYLNTKKPDEKPAADKKESRSSRKDQLKKVIDGDSE